MTIAGEGFKIINRHWFGKRGENTMMVQVL